MADDTSFFTRFPGAFAYPFKGRGPIVLVAGAIFFWVMHFIARFGLFGVIFGFLASGYLCAYLMKVIVRTASGDEEAAGFPDFTDWVEDIIRPFFRMVFVVVICFAPAAAVAFLLRASLHDRWPLVAAAGAAGLLYFPMALTAAAIRNDFFAAMPHIVGRMIIAVPVEYAIALVMMGVVLGVRIGLQVAVSGIPVLGGLVTEAITLYCLTVQMRLLGLVFHSNEDKLGWLVEA